MSKEKKFHCEFCRLNAMREEALKSNDIDIVKEALKKFADMWLNVDEDLSYYKCIMDGSWPTADVILTDALEKFKNHPNRDLE